MDKQVSASMAVSKKRISEAVTSPRPGLALATNGRIDLTEVKKRANNSELKSPKFRNSRLGGGNLDDLTLPNIAVTSPLDHSFAKSVAKAKILPN